MTGYTFFMSFIYLTKYLVIMNIKRLSTISYSILLLVLLPLLMSYDSSILQRNHTYGSYIEEILSQNKETFGYTSGSFQVNDNGASIYEIPLFTSPGTSGFAPNLSLIYSSQSGNGLLGEGWILNGLSIISRVPSTIAQDGLIDGLDFDEHDRFVIDGQRLISLNEEDYYKNNNEYRTEQNSFKKIMVSGGGQPESFVVFTKDGLKYTYGRSVSANSKVLFDGEPDKIMFWLVDKIEDKNGNYIEINYEVFQKESEFRPKEIIYTGNHKTGLIPYNLIEFKYEDRDDARFQYINGGKSSISKRLNNVSIYNSEYTWENRDVLVRNYQFDYFSDVVNGKSYLSTIKECSRTKDDKETCLDPVKFQWENTEANPILNENFKKNKYGINLSERHKILYGDLNKDGIPDKLLINNLNDQIEITYLLNNGKGRFFNAKKRSINIISDLNAYVQLADFDLDSDADILVSWVNKNKLHVNIIETMQNIGDISFSKSKMTFSETLNVSQHADDFLIENTKYVVGNQDLNGDGLVDIILYYHNGKSFFYHGFYNEFHSKFVHGGDFSHPTGDIPVSQIANIIDLNGDKLKDILFTWTDDSGWYSQAYLNGIGKRKDRFKLLKIDQNKYNSTINRDEYFEIIQTIKDSIDPDSINIEVKVVKDKISKDNLAKNSSIQLADINEDGNPDLLLSNTGQNGWNVYVAHGLGNGKFDTPNQLSVNTKSFKNTWSFATCELNGDGLLDLIIYTSGSNGFESHFALGNANSTFRYESNNSLKINDVDFSYKISENIEGLLCNQTRSNWTNKRWRPLIQREHEITFTKNRKQVLDAYSLLVSKLYKLSPIESGYMPENQRKPFFSKDLGSCDDKISPYPSNELDWKNNIKIISKVSGHNLRYKNAVNRAGNRVETAEVVGDIFFEIFNFWKLNITDLNGDGISDIVLDYPKHPKSSVDSGHFNDLDKELTDFILVNNSKKSGLIKKIVQGNNSEILIDYVPLADKEVYDNDMEISYPFLKVNAPLYVTKSTNSSNGIGGYNEVKYKYFDGITSVDGRGFLGFTKILKSNPNTRISTITEYFTSQHFPSNNIDENELLEKGIRLLKSKKRLYKDTIAQEEKVLEKIENTPKLEKYGKDGKYFMAYIHEVAETKFDLNTEKLLFSTVSNFEYDEYGNLLKLEVNHNDGLKEQTLNEYDVPKLNNWILGRLTEVKVIKTLNNITEERTTQFEYDKNNGQLITEIVNPFLESKKLVKRYTFDHYGNVISSTLEGKVDLRKEQKRTTLTDYDSKGRFVTRIVDALGYSKQSNYDYAIGNIIQEIDFNGNKTMHEYDEFGNLLKSVDELNNTKELITRKCTSCQQPSAFYFSLELDSRSTPKITFYDQLSRVIKEQKLDYKERIVSLDIKYDFLGRVISRTNPYFPLDSIESTYYQYDPLGRVVRKTSPTGLKKEFRYEGLETEYIDQDDKSFTEIKNMRGKVIKKIENEGTETKIQYDLFDNPISISENCSNTLVVQSFNKQNELIFRSQSNSSQQLEKKYNAFGELIFQRINEDISNFSYDVLGRLIEKMIPENTTKWFYVASNENLNGKGQVKEIRCSNNNILNQKFDYDFLGRPISHTYIDRRNNSQYNFRSKYNLKNELVELIYPAYSGDFSLKYEYQMGQLIKIKNGISDDVYWELGDTNSHGKVDNYKYGNGVSTNLDYLPQWKKVSKIEVKSGDDFLDNLSYNYDKVGRIEKIENSLLGLVEEFKYDNRDRIIKTQVGEYQTSLEYDCMGKILSKSDIGQYSYNDKFELISAGEQKFDYDIKGNRINGFGSYGLIYNSQNKPYSIFDDKLNSKIFYCDNNRRQRVITELKKGIGKRVEETIYLGEFIEKTTYKKAIFGKPKFKHERIHLLMNGSPFAYIDRKLEKPKDPIVQKLNYTHKDIFGNTVFITSSDSRIVKRFSFDIWGRKRCSTTWRPIKELQLSDKSSSDRCDIARSAFQDYQLSIGFQNHQFVKWTNLLDMGGRFYDPQLGLFTSIDPVIDIRFSNQGMNPYAYVLNNPLKYQDPSGYSIWGVVEDVFGGAAGIVGGVLGGVSNFLDKNMMTIVIVGVGIATGGAAIAAYGAAYGTLGGAVAFSAGFGFGSAFSGAILSGVSFNDAMRAGFTSAAISATAAAFTYGVGTVFTPEASQSMTTAQRIGKTLSHGAVQGSFRELQGGKFEHGFLAGSFSALASPIISKGETRGEYSFARIAKSAAVGGTASFIGGGKFANGAISGAMVHAFNQVAHEKKQIEAERRLITSKANLSFGNYAQYGNNGTAGISVYAGVGGGVFRNVNTGDWTFQVGYGIGVPGVIGVAEGFSYGTDSSFGIFATGTFMGVNGNIENNFYYNNLEHNYNLFVNEFEAWIMTRY